MKLKCLEACLLTLLFVGCSREEGAQAGGEISVLEMSPKQVMVRVNDAEISFGDFQNRFNLETAIYTKKNAKRNGFETSLKRFQASRFGQVLPQLVNLSLIKGYLKANDIQLDVAAEKALGQSVNQLKRKATLEDLAADYGVKPDYLREQLIFPEMMRVACEHFDPSCRSVSEQEVDEGLARQDRYYERAVASNKVTWATCSNVLAKVRGGMDFAEAGAKYGVGGKDEATEWDRSEPSDIENKGLRSWAFSAPVGSVGGPFDIEDGLCLVKILSRKDGTMEDSVVSEGVAEVTLARINFNMVVEEPEPRTRDFVRGALLKWKHDRAQKNLFEKLHREMRVEYPHGTNFTFKGELEK